MKEKYIKLIDRQIAKLSEDDFDLEAWKSSTLYVLKLIFGEKDEKGKEIEKLKIDYGSWALRDASANYKPIETCKKKGKEILEIAKEEVDIMGVHNPLARLDEQLKTLLTDDQYTSFTSPETSQDARMEILKPLTKQKLVEILSNVY